MCGCHPLKKANTNYLLELVDTPVRCCGISKYHWNQKFFRSRDWNKISQKDKGVGVKFWEFSWNLDLFLYGKWRGLGTCIVDCDLCSVRGGPTRLWTYQSSSAQWLWCMGARCGCLRRKRGSLETSSIVAQGGGATYAAEQRGVVVAATWALARVSFCAR
jgi:hypothetical protein